MPDTSKLGKLNRELEKSEKKLRKAINDEKALQHQLKQLTRKERTHRLCTRGGMLESFLQAVVETHFSQAGHAGTIEKTAGTGEAGNPLVY